MCASRGAENRTSRKRHELIDGKYEGRDSRSYKEVIGFQASTVGVRHSHFHQFHSPGSKSEGYGMSVRLVKQTPSGNGCGNANLEEVPRCLADISATFISLQCDIFIALLRQSEIIPLNDDYKVRQQSLLCVDLTALPANVYTPGIS